MPGAHPLEPRAPGPGPDGGNPVEPAWAPALAALPQCEHRDRRGGDSDVRPASRARGSMLCVSSSVLWLAVNGLRQLDQYLECKGISVSPPDYGAPRGSSLVNAIDPSPPPSAADPARACRLWGPFPADFIVGA